ncbi:hypothetical protein [Agrobacterium radiobacter]|uniref:hypothetical protein n=1 Tax=Agrobacterium radiobacter TaxID=362 RepID=UPI000ABB71B6|nr:MULTISPECIES: hypothetical protein [Agrobacterium tumefaciens complex]
MSLHQPGQVRFPFHSQLARDDGGGVRVLQMLTGMTYDEVARLAYRHADKNQRLE